MGNTQQKDQEDAQAHNGQGNPVFTCQICVEPMQSNQIFNNKNKCAHAVCKDCVTKYIQAKIDAKVPNIQCPGLNCNQFLDPLFCKKIIQKSRCFLMNLRCGTCFCHKCEENDLFIYFFKILTAIGLLGLIWVCFYIYFSKK